MVLVQTLMPLVASFIIAVFMMMAVKTKLRILRNGHARLCLTIIITAVIFVCIMGAMLHSDKFIRPDGGAQSIGKQPQTSVASSQTRSNGFFYGIMFDAGSTGSRIHVFKFSQSGRYRLEDELFEKIKPGLSAYADRPKEGAESLRPLLEKAQKYIPEAQWAETPMALKATAGLRLLSNETAQHILDEVTKLFKSYRFKMSEDSVAILEGADEGLFCWFTVNFLHGLLSNSTSMMGVLDLGGGSTQITFVLASKSGKDKKRMVTADIFGNNYTLYSHSYLGLGLNSGRYQVLGGKETASGIKSETFHSPCLPTNHSMTWKHGGKDHTLRGLPNTTAPRFDECYSVVNSVIRTNKVDQPIEIKNTTFYALSYYVDRATDVKLIDDKAGEGKVVVENFYEAAKRECAILTKDDAFRCLDLCYIFALLHDGLGLHRQAPLHLRKQINDIEIAWPLGAMFDVYGQFRRHFI